MPLAWSYARVSSTAQAGADRSGLERQDQALAGWLRDHPDYQLQEALADHGVSASQGRNRTRGALARFLAAADAGQVPAGSVLVVESLSRFSREAERQVLTTLLADFWARGIDLAVVAHGAIYSADLIDREPHRLHLLLGAMSQARAEADERSRRATGAAVRRREQQDQGLAPPAKTPFWLTRAADGSFRVDTGYARTIALIFQLAADGLGANRIARELNERGHQPPPRASTWRDYRVLHLLASEAPAGTLVRSDRQIPSYYPAIVTPAQVTAARTARDQRRHQRRNGATRHCKNLFEGLSFCSHCLGPLRYMGPARASRPGAPGYIACQAAVVHRSCQSRGSIHDDGWEAHGLVRLHRAHWEMYLGGPERNQSLADLQQQEQAMAAGLATLAAVIASQERRAEDEWAANPDSERLGTIERLLSRQRRDLARLSAEHQQLAEALAQEQAKPDSAEAAAEWRAGVAQFMQAARGASGADRIRFNRWLASRQPQIRLLLDVPGRRVALQVGGSEPDWQPIDKELALAALAQGAAEATFFGGIDGGLGAGAEWAE